VTQKNNEIQQNAGGSIRVDTLFCQQASKQYLEMLEACGGDPRSVAALEALAHGGVFVESADSRAEGTVPFANDNPRDILRRLGLID
jgi:hypothetical protein